MKGDHPSAGSAFCMRGGGDSDSDRDNCKDKKDALAVGIRTGVEAGAGAGVGVGVHVADASIDTAQPHSQSQSQAQAQVQTQAQSLSLSQSQSPARRGSRNRQSNKRRIRSSKEKDKDKDKDKAQAEGPGAGQGQKPTQGVEVSPEANACTAGVSVLNLPLAARSVLGPSVLSADAINASFVSAQEEPSAQQAQAHAHAQAQAQAQAQAPSRIQTCPVSAPSAALPLALPPHNAPLRLAAEVNIRLLLGLDSDLDLPSFTSAPGVLAGDEGEGEGVGSGDEGSDSDPSVDNVAAEDLPAGFLSGGGKGSGKGGGKGGGVRDIRAALREMARRGLDDAKAAAAAAAAAARACEEGDLVTGANAGGSPAAGRQRKVFSASERLQRRRDNLGANKLTVGPASLFSDPRRSASVPQLSTVNLLMPDPYNPSNPYTQGQQPYVPAIPGWSVRAHQRRQSLHNPPPRLGVVAPLLQLGSERDQAAGPPRLQQRSSSARIIASAPQQAPIDDAGAGGGADDVSSSMRQQLLANQHLIAVNPEILLGMRARQQKHKLPSSRTRQSMPAAADQGSQGNF